MAEPGSLTAERIARLIVHTNLNPMAIEADIDRLCEEAAEHDFAAVCVNPVWVPRAKENLLGTAVGLTSVASFPLGASLLTTKAFEATQAMRLGATGIDMVINIAALKEGRRDSVKQEIAIAVQTCEAAVITVVIETCYLTKEEIVLACRLAEDAGARSVATSTGFGPLGATPENVRLMKAATHTEMLVKASGGIRGFGDAKALVEAGAARLGTSSGLAILYRTSGDGTGH